MDRQWRLQDAKTHLSQVVEAALRGEAQHITRRGRAAVVVLAEEEYRQLQRNALAQAPGFIDHLLAMPRGGEDLEPTDLVAREFDFE